MARTYVELHPLPGESVILKIGSTIIRNDDIPPVFSSSSRIQVLETTNRVDGPFDQGKLYNSQTDAILPAPPVPGPTAEELRSLQLRDDDAKDQSALDTLIDKDHTTWTVDDRAFADKVILRRQEINRLG